MSPELHERGIHAVRPGAGVTSVTEVGFRRTPRMAATLSGPAFASNNPVTGNIVGNGNIPILSGNNVQIPVQIPVDICGNAVGLLGFANASCQGGAAAFLDSFNG